MASHFLSRFSAIDSQKRRHQVRKVLLETLERRELLAADWAIDLDQSLVSRLIRTAGTSDEITFTSSSNGMSGYDVTAYLDQTFGNAQASASLTDRPWFGLIEERYRQWSHENGLAYAFTTGLIAEGEGGGLLGEGESHETALDRYVRAPDPSYSFNIISTTPGAGYTLYDLEMTSQTWRTVDEINWNQWRHRMSIVIPNSVTSSKSLLVIGGGSHGGTGGHGGEALQPTQLVAAAQLAVSTGTVVSAISNVPYQPLRFRGEANTRFEDSIIAKSYREFLDGTDDNWPVLLPMVKSAVRAMDTVQTVARQQRGVTVTDFVVTGASKRGWTTWLTAAVDPRVSAIAPQVINVLNMDEQMKHHKSVYQGVTNAIVGGYSAWVADYVTEGIFNYFDHPRGQELLKIVDPYEYRDRLTMPKFMVNGTGDQFFVPDSDQFFFGDLPGQKYIRYIPNVGHGLGPDAITSLAQFYASMVGGTSLPQFSWTVEPEGIIQVNSSGTPIEARLWQSTNSVNRDFRQNISGTVWTSTLLSPSSPGIYVASVPRPQSGHTAFMVELTYVVAGQPMKFTTEVAVISAASSPGQFDDGPRLLSVAPNSGEIFSFNTLNAQKISPTELVFRFDDSIDSATLGGIQVVAAGRDGIFGNGNDRLITPGWIGAGDSARIIIMRFAEPLKDDLYRVQLLATGSNAVRNIAGKSIATRTLDSTSADRTIESLDFNLELGTRITAVVPQPVTRNGAGVLVQSRNTIEVYFDDADRMYPTNIQTGTVSPNPTVVSPEFYKLYVDRGTVSNADDIVFVPTNVQYNASRNMVVLTFPNNIDQLSSNFTTFRLTIGTNEHIPAVPVTLSPATDPVSTFNGSHALPAFAGPISIVIREQIQNSSVFPLDFPGAPDTPGKRKIYDDPQPGESHLLDDTPDSDIGIKVQYYNFNKVTPLGVDSFGLPRFNSITPAQEQRAREIFEFYSSLIGVQFIETDNRGWTIATSSIDGPGSVLGVADGVSAIMDSAESWWDALGASDDPNKASWFAVAFHEIGHLLGLGHNTEQPPGTNMGGAYSNVTLGGDPIWLGSSPIEPIFPGAAALAGARYLHRPDSRDIDMYRFEIPANETGIFTAEIVAERLAESSLLDSLLTLYRERPDGTREVIAVNDGYFSKDSYLNVTLQSGVYFLGVSASGNAHYDPENPDSGLGGTSEGRYELRTTFRPLNAVSIVDTNGSALDGDGDGIAGGAFNFWFNAGAPNGQQTTQRRTLFVDKQTGSATGNGSLATPYLTIQQAFAAAQPGDIVRVVPNGGFDNNVSTLSDNFAFEIGRGGVGNQPLSDGVSMEIPKGVTVMIDAGTIFKMGRSSIGVGSSTVSVDRSNANLQVLGTPESSVIFTSYNDEQTGRDTNPLSTVPAAGDWGGIAFRNSLDRSQGRFDSEIHGRFVNFVSHTDFRYGGGRVPVDGQDTVINPIYMDKARPTAIFNTLRLSASAAMSADPDSFEVTNFSTPRFQSGSAFTPSYNRVGPDLYGNTVIQNSINGLFVRVETPAGQSTIKQSVSARWNDREIVHVVADALTIGGTPGGPILEDVTVPLMAPNLNVVNISSGGSIAGGQLNAGSSYRFVMTFLDPNGFEGVASQPTNPFVVPAGSNAIRLSNLPPANRDFVARRLYRSENSGSFQLVAELDRSSTIYIDSSAPRNTLAPEAGQIQRARLDASLFIDPGIIVKLNSGRIATDVGAQFVAEGTTSLPVVFTSRRDDRFGAGGTFDTNFDQSQTQPAPGDWSGLYFGHTGLGSLDHVIVTYGGGASIVAGSFANFNAIEVHQADLRIANSIIENNASGSGESSLPNRNGLGFNTPAAIFSRGSQPIIVDNIIRNNLAPAISIDPQSMSGNPGLDFGRSTGFADRRANIKENKGPLIRGNFLGNNSINGMDIRGGTLNTESVWDDTDITHVVQREIVVPDFFIFGGLRLQSSPDSSLVVKFGPGAGLTSAGRPLEIADRIGGTLQVLGTPGFPVILTSLSDDSIGGGFDPSGRAQTDTNNDGPSTGSPGQWRSLRIAPFSNDRNVVTLTEYEPGSSTGTGVNGNTSTAQMLGSLASREKASDENLRLGFTVFGTMDNPDDVDVYGFAGIAGTQVWLDVDRTDGSLDSVLELIDSNGNVIARSDNSYAESIGSEQLFVGTGVDPKHVNPMPNSIYGPRNFGNSLTSTFADLYSTNLRDPGMRVVLPGSAGSSNRYFVRLRSLHGTQGQYQLQLRLRQTDEIGGSSINLADIRFAQNGIEVLGMPTHSPLVGEAAEPANNNNDSLATALNLGNLLNVDRAELSIAGALQTATDVDWYRFDIDQKSIQSSGLRQHISTILDVDYADGLGPNTTLWLFYNDRNNGGNGIRLVAFGTDSSIADDIGAPLRGSDLQNLSRGSAGSLDPFIGSIELPSGTYYLAITSNQLISSYLSQFYSRNPGDAVNTRVEPVNSVRRVVEDRFGPSGPASQTAFDTTGGGSSPNVVPYHLGDVVLFVSQRSGLDTSDLITINPLTGQQISLVSRFPFVEDIAMRGDGTLHGSRAPQTGIRNDANAGGILVIDTAGNGTTTAATTTSGIQTFELDFSTIPPTVQQAVTPGTSPPARQGRGMEFYGLTYHQVGIRQFLYGAASRFGTQQFQSFTGQVDAQNFIYKLDPGSFQATSLPLIDRQGDGRVAGAGTQIVERGYIDTSRDAGPRNLTSQTVLMADASPTNLPALLSGDLITLQDANGVNRVFQWTNAELSATLIADTLPQSRLNGPRPIPAPTNYFRDGQSFSITSGTNTTVFEIETGRVMINNYVPLTDPATYDGYTFTITDSAGNVATFEFDSNNAVNPLTNPVPVPYNAQNSTQEQVTQSIIQAINNAGNFVPGFQVRAWVLPGTNRISLLNDQSLVLSVETPDPLTGITPRSPLTVSTLLNNSTGSTIGDGTTFEITVGTTVTTFEFDDIASLGTSPGNIPVLYAASFSQRLITEAINDAINSNSLGLQSFILSDDTLRILGDSLVTMSPSSEAIIPGTGLPRLVRSSPEYGNQQFGATNVLILVEEIFTNLGEIVVPIINSTPSAMLQIVAAINAQNPPLGVTASALGTRLILTGATSVDFTNISTIAYSQPEIVPGAIVLPFEFTDSATALNQQLLAAIRQFEPLAQLVQGGRIWLPARSTFVQPASNDRGDAPSYNAEFSIPNYGLVTGIAFAGTAMYAVSNRGDLYRVGGSVFDPDSSFNNGDFIETIYDTVTGQRVQFASLAAGPRNAESSNRYSTLPNEDGLDQILFGIATNGKLYAFDTLGRPAHVFPDGNWFIQTNATNVTGIAFANLDVNLWHETSRRGGIADTGHGINVSFDGNRRTQGLGGNSLYFGFEDPRNSLRQSGDWSGINNPLDSYPGYDPLRANTYDFPGGAKGSIISNPIDLSSFGPADKPMLYFNYFLQTENANANNPFDLNFMRDAFRVFVSDETGAWQLLATNNSDYDARRGVGQLDELDTPFLVDPDNALTRQVSELFDSGETFGGQTAPIAWRQARIDLSRFAGQSNLRLRFDFSTAGTVNLGATELIAIPAADIPVAAAQRRFVIDGVTFEFDFGLMLQIPSGASITAGSQFSVDGVMYTFADNNVGTNIQFAPSDTAATIAQRIAEKIATQGLTARIDPKNLSRISVVDAVDQNPFVSPSLPVGFVIDTPGAAGSNRPIKISRDMSAAQVRDAIRVALAARFNIPGQESNLATWRFHDNIIYLWNRTVNNRGPLGLGAHNQGNEYGETPSGVTSTLGRGAQRGQNNRFEGVYIDDIIIGAAERGEMVTYQGNSVTLLEGFVPNPQHEPAPGYSEIETGAYQIGIRPGATYGLGGSPFPNLEIESTFHTNDRFTQAISLVAPPGSLIADGMTFTLSDGVNTVTYEYDDVSIISGPSLGVAQGNIRIPFSAQNSAVQVASSIRDAINGAQSRAILDVTAALADGTVTGLTNLGKTSGSSVIHVHGNVAASTAGSHLFGGTEFPSVDGANNLGFILHGIPPTFRHNRNGDDNINRDQGVLMIQNNIVRSSSEYGIVVDAGSRTNPLIPDAGLLPRPGSARNLASVNTEALVPGAIVMNNLVFDNGSGGIRFSGDPRTNDTAQAPTPFGRIVNNTVVGRAQSGVGIDVSENASPTLLNNIISSFSTAVRIDSTSSTTVLAGMIYHNNLAPITNPGSNAEILTLSSPLFLDPTRHNYYLQAGSLAIDSSVESFNDRQTMTTVRQPLGIADSPILAPDVDVYGQLRIDDPNTTPVGVGANTFKDRGAIERADFEGPLAIIQNPLDNDPDNSDIDRSVTYIDVNDGLLNSFSILLFEAQGTGPDALTVTQDAVVLTENGKVLRPGIDYVFGFDPSSRLIRLTPRAGFWRRDSVYEITLNNSNTHRVTVPSGSTLSDGDRISVNRGSTTLVLEFDNDGQVENGNVQVPFNANSTAYEISTRLSYLINQRAVTHLRSRVLGSGQLVIHGATNVTSQSAQAGLDVSLIGAIRDLAGNPVQPNRATGLTQFTIVMPDVLQDYGDSNGASIPTIANPQALNGNGGRHAIFPVDVPALALGTWSSPDADGRPSPAADADDFSTSFNLGTLGSVGGITQQPNGPARLILPAAADLDGQQIVISDSGNIALAAITFEFDTNSSSVPAPNKVIVSLLPGDNAQQVAGKLAQAVWQTILTGRMTGLIPVADGNQLSLGGTSKHRFVLSGAPSVQRLAAGNVMLVVPTNVLSLTDGQTMTITDSMGRVVEFELNTTGGVTPGRVPINVNLPNATPGQVAFSIATAIQSQIRERRLWLGDAIANGATVSIIGDDEDGISFGGLFNALSKPVAVYVESTDFGMLDAWIDWNGNGSFNDSGDRVALRLSPNDVSTVATSVPVRPGVNVFYVQTPTNAAVGVTTARFRLSVTGDLLTGGAGVGGEIEDHLIEIVGGAPPIVVENQYSVNEDQVLSVNNPSNGVLANDNDPDIVLPNVIQPGINLWVNNENPASAQIVPLVNTAFGDLVLNPDGTFTYTPRQDFNGIDVFVYRATDGRLVSNQPATVTITVNPVNDPPLAVNDTVSIREDQTLSVAGSTFTSNDFQHFRMAGSASGFHTNEIGQTLTVTQAAIVSDTTTDFGIAGVSVRFASRTGQGAYGNVVSFANTDLGSGGAPQVTVTTETVAGNALRSRVHVVLNSNAATPTTIQQALAAINNHPVAGGLVQGTLLSGSPSTVIGSGTTSYSPAVIPPSGGSVTVVNNQITYTPPLHYNDSVGGPAIVRLTIADDGTAGPVAGLTSESLLTINIRPINDAPAFTLSSNQVTVREDEESITGVSPTVITNFVTTIAPGPATALDERDQQLQFEIVSVSDPSLFSVPPTISLDGRLSFQTAQDRNGVALVKVRLVDNGPGPETQEGDVRASAEQTITINIRSVNDAPVFNLSSSNVSSIEDQGLVTINGFLTGVLPGPLTAVDEQSQVVTISVVALDPSKFVVQPTIDPQGRLTYQTRPDVNDLNSDLRVRLVLTDNGPAPNNPPGSDDLPHVNRAEVTFTISVQPINDAPQFTLTSSTVRISEDHNGNGVYTSNPANPLAINVAPGPATAIDELSQSLEFVIVSVSNPDMFVPGQLPAITPAGLLNFRLRPHRNGSSVVIVRLRDNGAGDPPPNANLSAQQTFTITVDPVNDAPEFAIPSVVSVNESQGLVSIAGFATGIRPGPVEAVDESSQLVNFEVEAIDPSVFVVLPEITPSGTLSFRVADNINSENALLDGKSLQVRVRLLDNGPSSPPNVNASAWITFTINVIPVNDPPISPDYVTQTTEDTPITILASQILANASGGPTSDEGNQRVWITQVGSTSARGGTITPVFNAAGTEIISITYLPPRDGVGTDSFVFVMRDDGTPPRQGTASVIINILAVNDAPQFDRGVNPVVTEDSGRQEFNNWATNILPGPVSAIDELASQAVRFEVVRYVSGEELFSATGKPAISSAGVLTFEPALDAAGVAVFVIQAVDNGSPNARSEEVTVTITIQPINDPPVFTSGGNVAVAEDSGAYSQVWATNVAPAAGLNATPQRAVDEGTQTVTFTVISNSQSALFSVQPAVSSAGVLTFTPAPNSFGAAVIVVQATDSGPSNAPNINTSSPVTFTITITQQNDAPVANNDSYSIDENSVLTVTAPGVLANDTDTDLPDDQLRAVAGSLQSTFGAAVVLNENGSFTYDPRSVLAIQRMTSGQSIIDSFVYTIRDRLGAASNQATVSITVTGVDDPPVAVDDSFTVGVGQTTALSILANDTDVDSLINPASVQITRLPIFGTAVVLPTGIVQYTAGPGFIGTDTFGYTVKDAAGNVSNEALVTVLINNPPVANDDTAVTYKNQAVVISVLSNDTDSEGSINPSTVQVVTPPSSGSAEVLPDGRIRFTPEAGFSGLVTFTYTVADNMGLASNEATVTVRVRNSRWQNTSLNLDVNASGHVSAIDALLVINYLNSGQPRFLPDTNFVAPPFIDVNGDERVSSIDALLVINELNRRSGGGGAGGGGEGEGEGEAASSSSSFATSVNLAMMVTPQQMIDTVGRQVARQVQQQVAEQLQQAIAASPQPMIGPLLANGRFNGTEPSSSSSTSRRAAREIDDDLLTLLSSSSEMLGSKAGEVVDRCFAEE